MLAPKLDQVEVSVIGPGYGECSLVHIGDGKWIIVDSCIDSSTGEPAALNYLERMGVNPAEAVVLILATHWHDDHVRGLAQILKACTSAIFCSSSAYNNEEFLASVLPYEERNTISGRSGIKELFEILHILEERTALGAIPRKAVANRRVLHFSAEETDHGNECSVWTLSPSDKQIENFLSEITVLVPQVKTTKLRATHQVKNNLSVVLWVEVGMVRVLLGADLEETGDPCTGWSVIVASKERPVGKAQIYKIPHHGAVNGHNDTVWDEMLVEAPFAALTPYNKGRRKRPDPDDVNRILGKTPNGYSTAKVTTKKSSRRRSTAVEKTIKQTVGKLRLAEPSIGHVQIRNGGNSAPEAWSVELMSSACPLVSLV